MTADRVCTVCGDPIIFAYMGLGEEPVDTLHATKIGTHDHDATASLADIEAEEDGRYGQPPAGWAE